MNTLYVVDTREQVVQFLRHLSELNNDSIYANRLHPTACIERADGSKIEIIQPKQLDVWYCGQDTENWILCWYSKEKYIEEPGYHFGATFTNVQEICKKTK